MQSASLQEIVAAQQLRGLGGEPGVRKKVRQPNNLIFREMCERPQFLLDTGVIIRLISSPMKNHQSFVRQQIDTGRLPGALVEKWGRSTLEEGFVPFPKKLLRCLPMLFRGQHGVDNLAAVLAIVDFRRPNLTRHPSAEFLAFIAGMKESDFMARLADLKSQALIVVGGDEDALEIDLGPLIKRINELAGESRDSLPENEFR